MDINDYIPHLIELKNRLLIIGIFFALAFLGCYYFSNDILLFILNKGMSEGYNFVYLQPQEVLVEQLKLDALLSLIITLPVIITEIILFIAPAIKSKLAIIMPVFFGTIMYLIGAAFSYYVLIPFVFHTLYELGISTGIKAQVSISSYISLYLTLLTSLGLIFELPLISLGLTRAGVLTSDRMKKGRRIAIVIALIIAALITPPDVLSQLIVAMPIILLYEFSIKLCKFAERNKEVEDIKPKNTTSEVRAENKNVPGDASVENKSSQIIKESVKEACENINITPQYDYDTLVEIMTKSMEETMRQFLEQNNSDIKKDQK